MSVLPQPPCPTGTVVIKEPSPVTTAREFQLLPARLTCEHCTEATAEARDRGETLAALINRAIGHVRDTGHSVVVDEHSRTIYSPAQSAQGQKDGAK